MRTDPGRLVSRGSPFELVEAEIDGSRCRVFKHAPSTLPALYQRARLSGARELLVADGTRISYQDVFRRADIVARRLAQDFGVRAGVRIGLILENTAEWVVCFLGITTIGATAVAVHRQAGAENMLAAIATAECAAVICDEESAGILRDAGERRPILVAAGPSSVDRIGVMGPSTDGAEAADLSSEQLGIVAFTSGSTGKPKGIELTHRSILTGLMNMILGAAIASLDGPEGKRGASRSSPVSMIVGPLSHVSGYGNLLLTLYLGGKLALMRRWDAATAAGMLESESVTSLVGATPEMMRELVPEIRSRGGAGSVRSIVVQGAALHSSLQKDIRAALPNVTLSAGYGMTETNGSVCVISERSLEARPQAVGRPLPTVELRIVRADGSDAPIGEAGEVRVRGAMLMRGYCNNPLATSKALQHGWLSTGDVGRLDEEGFLYILDRASQVIVSGGVRISCSEIERAVMESQVADDVAAFGVGEAGEEERVVVAVVSRSAEMVDSAQIAELLANAGIQGVRRPQILRLDRLPLTVSGKVDRMELRRRILES